MRSALQSNGFKAHNNKSKELVASKFHSSIRNVRIVVSTGIDKSTGKAIAGKQAHFKAVYINNQSQWRTIASGGAFKGTKSFGSYLKAIEVAATSGPTCKCGAKKFKAKSGNVVCANACWANKGWSSAAHRAKYEGTKKNTSQPKKRPAMSTPKKKSIRAEILRKRMEAKKKPEGTYTTFVPGQLVKIVEPQQDSLADFIGTVTKVEAAAGRPSTSKLMNVNVMWMHSGVTDRHHNYNSGTDTATYLVHA